MSYKGPRCECGQPKQRRAGACSRCLELEQQYRTAESVSGRVLAMLARCDGWLIATDIADALGERRERVSARLAYMAEHGDVERRWERGMGMVYRRRGA